MSGETGERTPNGEPRTPPAAAPAGRVRKALAGLGFLLGIGPVKTPEPGAGTADKSTRLAQRRTDLALERNYMAAERTLMGWIRTTLAMISFGFTLGKLGEALHTVEVKGVLGSSRTVSVDSIAYFLVVVRTQALLGAAVQDRLRMHELNSMGLRRQISITFTVAVLVAVVGGFALTSLVLKL